MLDSTSKTTGSQSVTNAPLAEIDPELAAALDAELGRQRGTLGGRRDQAGRRHQAGRLRRGLLQLDRPRAVDCVRRGENFPKEPTDLRIG